MKTNPDSRPIIEIGEANFESEVLRWKQPVLVAFSAAWSRPASALKSKRGAQSQADGLCQGSRQFGQTLKIETYQSTKQANYENTQNPKYTKPNRFKNETFQ